MTDFYEKLFYLKEKEKYVMALVIEGPHEGERAVFRGKEIVFMKGDRSFWELVLKDTEAVSSGNVVRLKDDRVYLERLSDPLQMVICGAGHVSLQLIKLAKMTGFRVTAIDDRKEFTDAAEAAGADKTICAPFEEALASIEGDGGMYFVILTRGHISDRLCLEAVLRKPNAYIGMIGSRARVAKQLSDMERCGFEKAELDRVHTPIGLAIGAETPEEIAVSIMAEIIQEKNQAVKINGFDKRMLRTAAGQDPARNGQKMALALLTEKSGSGPRNPGTKMLVFEDGSIIGTIGGGMLEFDTIKSALDCMQSGKNTYYLYQMSLKDAMEEGMACGGSAGIYIDVI